MEAAAEAQRRQLLAEREAALAAQESKLRAEFDARVAALVADYEGRISELSQRLAHVQARISNSRAEALREGASTAPLTRALSLAHRLRWATRRRSASLCSIDWRALCHSLPRVFSSESLRLGKCAPHRHTQDAALAEAAAAAAALRDANARAAALEAALQEARAQGAALRDAALTRRVLQALFDRSERSVLRS